MIRLTSLVALVAFQAMLTSEVMGSVSNTGRLLGTAMDNTDALTAYPVPSSAFTPLLVEPTAPHPSSSSMSLSDPVVEMSSPTTLLITPIPGLAAATEPSGRAIDAVANIDPAAGKHAKAKSVVRTEVGDAKVKAKVVVRNTLKGPVARTKVKVHGKLPPGTTVNAIGKVGNTTLAQSSTTA